MVRDRSLIPLSHDHQHALALCVQIRRALSGPTSADTVQGLAGTVISYFESEMRGHFECEENVLFPVLARIEATRPLVEELVGEHREIEAMAARMRSGPDVRLLETFAETLTQHVRKEERALFEEAQRLLSREELDALGSAILARRSPSPIDHTDG